MVLMPYLWLTGSQLRYGKKPELTLSYLAGLIGNRTSKHDLIDKYIEAVPMPVLEVLPLIEDIRDC